MSRAALFQWYLSVCIHSSGIREMFKFTKSNKTNSNRRVSICIMKYPCTQGLSQLRRDRYILSVVISSVWISIYTLAIVTMSSLELWRRKKTLITLMPTIQFVRLNPSSMLQAPSITIRCIHSVRDTILSRTSGNRLHRWMSPDQAPRYAASRISIYSLSEAELTRRGSLTQSRSTISRRTLGKRFLPVSVIRLNGSLPICRMLTKLLTKKLWSLEERVPLHSLSLTVYSFLTLKEWLLRSVELWLTHAFSWTLHWYSITTYMPLVTIFTSIATISQSRDGLSFLRFLFEPQLLDQCWIFRWSFILSILRVADQITYFVIFNRMKKKLK